jgi:hypothetical protein
VRAALRPRIRAVWPPGVVLAALAGAVIATAGGPSDAQAGLGPERDASRWPGTEAEVSIAADRFHPRTAVAAAMAIEDGRMLVMNTADGGETWTRTALPLGDGATLDADPWLAFDSRGIVYLAKIPVIHGNDNLGIDVCRSMDGGRTWTTPVRISRGIGRDDKVSLAADDHPESPFRDRVYVAWMRPSDGLYFSSSSDGGASFTPPRRIEASGVTGMDMAIAADGTLYLAYRDYPTHAMRVLRSQDGGMRFSTSVRVADVRAGPWVLPPSACRRKALVYAAIAADDSESIDRGRLYLSWADYPPGITDSSCGDPCRAQSGCSTNVYVSRSSDGGITWSAPAIVHEPGYGSVDRYHQSIGVDPADGRVYVAYKDSRNDPARAGTDVYLSRSDDGGSLWLPSERLSSATAAAGSFFQYGDYQSLCAAGGFVYAAWADYRDDASAGEIYVRVWRAGEPYAAPPRARPELPGVVRPAPRTRPPRGPEADRAGGPN